MSIEVKTVAWLWWDANATGIDTGGKHGRYKVSDLDPTDIRAFAVVARSDLESAEARAQRAEQALREVIAATSEANRAALTRVTEQDDYDKALVRRDAAWAAARAIVEGKT